MLKIATTEPHPFLFLPIAGGYRKVLSDDRSMTTQLERGSGEKPAIKLLYEGWGRAEPDEAMRLGLPDGQLVWLRESELMINSVTLISARSVIPRQLLRGRYRILRSYGTRSLGELLFSSRSIYREHVWFGLEQGVVETVLRCSRFRLGRSALLLTESFSSHAMARLCGERS
mgnify:CR=1 FL=1